MLGFPQPNRTGDQCIMNVVSRRSSTPASTLRVFNRCRIYMQVTFLSELSTADGLRIDRQHWIGQRQRNSSILWPYQPAPGPKSFRIWRRLLATAFLLGHRKRVCPRTVDLRLQQPLGPWLHTSYGLRSSWSSFFSPSTRQLYQINLQHTLDIHSRTLGPRTRGSPTVIAFQLQPHDFLALSALPTDAAPVDLVMHPTFLSSSKTIPTILPATTTAPAPTWDEYLS